MFVPPCETSSSEASAPLIEVPLVKPLSVLAGTVCTNMVQKWLASMAAWPEIGRFVVPSM